MAVEKFLPMRKWIVKLTPRTKWITPSERALKTVHKNGVTTCVRFCLRSLGLLEKCEQRFTFMLISVPIPRLFCSAALFEKLVVKIVRLSQICSLSLPERKSLTRHQAGTDSDSRCGIHVTSVAAAACA